LSFTDCAVNGVPSVKVTPSRRWKVKVIESSLRSQLSASQGTISPVSGTWSVRESAICRETLRAVLLPACWPSAQVMSASKATRSVPPFTGGPV